MELNFFRNWHFFFAKKCERNIFIQSCYLKFAYRYIVVVECAISFRQEIALTFSFVSKFRMQFVQYDISYYWVVGSGSPCVYGKCVHINAVRMENVYRQRAHSPWHWNCERNEERHYLVQCCSAGGISMLSVQRSLFIVHCVRLFPCTSTIMLGHHHWHLPFLSVRHAPRFRCQCNQKAFGIRSECLCS